MQTIYDILGVTHVIICALLTLFVLLQKTTGNGLLVTSSTNPFLSGAEMQNVATKITKYLSALFLVNTLIIAVLGNKISTQSLIKTDIIQEKQNEAKRSNSEIPLSN